MCDPSRGGDQMLAVVEHDERASTLQELDQATDIPVTGSGPRDFERGHDRGHHLLGIGDVGQFDPPDIDRIGVQRLASRFDRES